MWTIFPNAECSFKVTNQSRLDGDILLSLTIELETQDRYRTLPLGYATDDW